MRRKDREISDPAEVRKILDRSDSCRIGFAVNGTPYIVAMNFGYRWAERLMLFFHCAKEGRKLELMDQNPLVCFQMDMDHELIRGRYACAWGMHYRSLAGTGMLSRIKITEEKIEGLNRIMAHYGSGENNEYDLKMVEATEVLKLDVIEYCGKKKTG
jgi:nitroimidazol reductase NimA-like FMN-containing flavoprotein (pyridoxamine 5'-phosphate oxidase superfamily)